MSLFGLLRKIKEHLGVAPTRGQVLLFLRPPGRKRHILNVFLLPDGVLSKEVKVHHCQDLYIRTTSDCDLYPGQLYRLQSANASHEVQPKAVTYHPNYGPNFHPTFEVTLNLNEDVIPLKLLGPKNVLCWEQMIEPDLKTSKGAGPSQPNVTTTMTTRQEAEMLLSVRREFIKRVSEPVLHGLLDTLLDEKVLNDGEMDSVIMEKGRKEKARKLIDLVRKKGNEASLKMIAILHEEDPTLHHQLGLNTPGWHKGDQCAGPSQPTMMTTSQEAEMLLSKQKEFINRVSESVLDGLLDNLLDEDVLNDEEVNSIRAEKYREEKARLLIDMVRNNGKEVPFFSLITALHQLDPTLHHHLGLEKEYLPGASSSQPNMPMTLLQQMEMLRTVMDERQTEPVLKLLLDNLLDDKVLRDEKMNPTRREKYLEEKAQKFITTLHQQDPKLYQRLGLADMRLSDEVDPSNMDITPFPPIVHTEQSTNEYRFPFFRAGLFQCTVTGLVFGTRGEGEVLCKVVRWERWLQSTGMTPAGPLFDIECPQQSVCQLRLPHCEVTPEGDLSVAHITNEEVNFLEPLKVTETHVVVNVTHLSFFGLVRSFFNSKPIEGQVLLFRKPPGDRRHEMSVFLLPRNVPINEVKSKNGHYEYIETPRHCQLTPDTVYSVHCPEASTVQPKKYPFKEDFNQYDPVFEVFMDLSTQLFSLEVQGPDQEEVWQRDALEAAWSRQGRVRGHQKVADTERGAAAAPSSSPHDVRQAADTDTERGAAAAPSSSPHDVRQAVSRAGKKRAGKKRHHSEQDDDDLTDREKARSVMHHRAELIQKVSTVMPIVDILGKVHPEIYADIYAKKTNMDRMRKLYMYVLEPGGTFIKAAFYNALKTHQPDLLEELEKASASSVLSEEQLLCPICLNVFTDPITTTCGHNFCEACITYSWDNSVECKCPICQKKFCRIPKVSVNRFLAEKAAEFKISQKETEADE